MRLYPSFSVLLVDDEPAWLRSLELMLMRSASVSNVLTCTDSREVHSLLEKHDIGLVLLDVTMPHISGEQLLASIHAQFPAILVIIITGMNTAETAMHCIKQGAFDYYVKTWGEERLATGIQHAIRVAELERAREKTSQSILSQDLQHPEAFANIITANSQMINIFHYIESIAASHYPVLITGESGVGKELVAHAVHNVVHKEGHFVSLNMASLEGNLLEDTLFGHVKGAYTNALGARAGLVEQAHNGTLFLDEIGELSLHAQAKLLRFIQEGEYYPVGGDRPKKLAARIVLATNQDINARQQTGEFRRDLYYRLATHHIQIPPLRERKEDIPLLVHYFLQKIAAEYGYSTPAITTEAVLALTEYNYPGNVRELQAMLTHALSKKSNTLELQDFSELKRQEPTACGQTAEQDLLNFFLGRDNLLALSAVKNIMTTAAMIKSGGNQSIAAKMLGISQPAMSKRLNAEDKT
ncbi:MAG: sigma-54 dependent transcriptional regulator [Desulfovibrionaceae bacterium]|nr:sigma-54 dependent transcriptional regulator [Desulfovibrionaceae bacterium]